MDGVAGVGVSSGASGVVSFAGAVSFATGSGSGEPPVSVSVPLLTTGTVTFATVLLSADVVSS